MGVLDATYAGPLRRVLNEFKLLEIVDMEALRKKTFRGIKRPTIIFFLENLPGSDADEVATTTLSMDCYDAEADAIDFSKAQRGRVRRSQIMQSSYVPRDAESATWMSTIADDETAAILTKISEADACVMERLAQAPRLGNIIKLAYRKRGRDAGPSVDRIPEGENPLLWEPYSLFGYGLKLGGSSALASSGLPIFKGQNIFPSGLIGEPMGFWDPKLSHVDSLLLYTHFHLLDHTKLYAIRQISQIPTACPVPANTVFQNTVQLAQLTEDFPLNLYLLSRIPQWFAIKVCRASIIEDLTTTWFKRGLLLLPIPPNRSAGDIAALRAAGGRVISRDKDLANAHRHVERLIADSPKKTLFDLFAENNSVVAGADLTSVASGGVVTAVHEQGDEVVSDDLFFRITVPNAALRKYLAYMLDRLVDEGDDVTFDRDTLGKLQVPADLENVTAAIDQMRSTDPTRTFQDALMELDQVVAQLFGMPEEDFNYITSAMVNDGFLKQLRPSFEHRGLRIQPYADHSQDDRYA